MITKCMGLVGLLVLLSVALVGCDKHDGHDHGPDGHSHDKGGTVKVPEKYQDAVAKIEVLSDKIGGLIEAGKLDELHASANDIKKIAEALSEKAQKELALGDLKQVNISAKALAGMFSELGKAAHSGNKAETIKVHQKMKGLIAALKNPGTKKEAHQPGKKGSHGHDHEDHTGHDHD